MRRAFGPGLSAHSPTPPEPWLRSGLIADAPGPRQNRRLELPFNFEVAA